MSRPSSGRLRPWIGSAVLHLLFVAVLVAAAYRWRSDEPTPPLAIEGNAVRYEDLPPSVKAGKPLREAKPKPVAPPVQEEVKPPPPPEPKPDVAAEAARREREAQEAKLVAEQKRADEQRALEAQKAKDAALAAEQKQAAEDARKRKVAEDAQRQAAAEAEARRKAEADAKLAAEKQQKEQAAREAKAQAERKAALDRELAQEEEGEAFKQSGVVDEYAALLKQTIERNWNRPASAKPGLKCTLNVTQTAGGTVGNVTVGECNGDQAVRESIVNAVYKSSPLPPPRDPRAFQRQLVIDFRPTE